MSDQAPPLGEGGQTRGLRELVAEMRMVAMVAGQYSVECPLDDAEAHAAYAARLKEWADKLEALSLTPGPPA